jgi:serine/threonine protein kinase
MEIPPLSNQPLEPTNDASPSDQPSNPSAESGAGTGYETLLGRLVVERGLVSPAELDDARARTELDAAGNLVDALVHGQYLTAGQVDRLKAELDSENSGRRIPGYRIIRKLGSGAMATVFLAKQLSLDRFVAIKVLPRRLSTNSDFIERFYKEGRAAARLNDPNIVAAYDVGQAGEHHFFVMEYVDGETVYERIKDAKRIKDDEAIAITRQVASALAHAHAVGFIHRDIKPKNIMISKEGTVKLADLGLARAMSDKEAAEAEAGKAFGTPFYISPEQIRGKVDIGPQADIYGLGATLYHMVTGRVPFKGKNPSEVMHRHLKDELTPPDHLNPDVSSGLAQIIEMMLAKTPADRYRTAAELIEDLDLVSTGEAPRYARSVVDISSVVSTMRDASKGDPIQPRLLQPSTTNTSNNALSMTTLAALILSVVLNAILIAVVLNR